MEKSTLNVESIDPQSKSYYDINSHTLSLRDYLGVFFCFHSKNVKETNNIDRKNLDGPYSFTSVTGCTRLKEKRQSREHFVIKQKLFYFKTVP